MGLSSFLSDGCRTCGECLKNLFHISLKDFANNWLELDSNGLFLVLQDEL